tara:strand:+ start:355 stop:1290 length:936 start_codon:yes stop_codon:yes gene_type:complete
LDDLLADLEGELDDELENNPDSKKKEAFSDLTSWEDVWKKAQKAIEDHFAHHVEKEFAIEDYAYDCNDSESYNTRVLFKYSPRSEGMTGNYFLSLWKGHFDGEINDDFMDYFSGETISSYLLFANNKSDNFESDIYKKFQDSLYSRVKDYVDAGIEIWDDKQVADYCASEGEKDINEELTSFRKYLNEGVISEGVNLDDKLDTLEDLDSWMDSEEIDDIFDDLVLDLNDKFGDELLDRFGWDYKEDDEREKYLDGDMGITRREMIAVILNYHINDNLLMFDTEEEDERYIKFLDDVADKAKEKYKITIDKT